MTDFKPFKGRVTDSGGGVVNILVDRDTAEYPPTDAEVYVSPRRVLRHVGWLRRHVVRYDGLQDETEELLHPLAEPTQRDKPVFELVNHEFADRSWEEDARRYAQNAEYWRERAERAEGEGSR